MSFGPFVGRNGISANNVLTVGNNSTIFVTANSSGVTVGNVVVSSGAIAIGALTINSTSLGGFTSNGSALSFGATTISATGVTIGDNVVVNTSTMFIGNSTVNAFANSTIFKIGFITSNTTAIGVGSNVFMDSANFFVGNSSVNSISNVMGLAISNSSANALLSAAALTVGQASVSNSGFFVGNTTVNLSISSTSISINGNPLLPHVSDIAMTIGNGLTPIASGSSGLATAPFDFAFNILSWSIIGKETANITIDIYKVSYDSYPSSPVLISNTAPITLSSAIKNKATAATWIPTVNVGELLWANVTSDNTATQVNINFKYQKIS